jgi:predicted dehydrogenase
MKASIIGTGFGSRTVATVYRRAGIECEVVSPRDAEAVKRACAAPVDLVSIHSPPFLHKEHVLLAVENGRNVVCDKPFGRCAAEAREMLAAAEAAGVIHLLNYEFRQQFIRRKAKELIEQGAIGTPLHIEWSSMMAGSRSPLKPFGWEFDRELGGGWIGTFGSHAIDAMRWWFGEIETVGGVCRTEIPVRPDKNGVERVCTAEDAFVATFTFESGATATLDTAYTSAANRPYRIEIFGSEGVLSMNFDTLLELFHIDGRHEAFPREMPADHDPSKTPQTWSASLQDGIHGALLPWAEMLRDAIREGRQIAPSFRDGVASAEVMDKLRANAVWTRPS